MKTALILVGKTVNKHLQACIDDYVERLGHYMPFELVGIPELKNTKNLSEEQQKEREGELILKQLQAQDYLVLLDVVPTVSPLPSISVATNSSRSPR